MEHIRKRDSISETSIDVIYTLVLTKEWTLPLSEHPSILEHSETFEVVDCELPEYFQSMRYVSNDGIIYE